MTEPRANDKHFVPGRKHKFCEPCKKKNKQTVAKVFCNQCGQFQCDDCEKAHEIFDFMSGHELVQANKASGVKRAAREVLKPSVDLNGLDVCGRHGKVFKFYCVDHATVLCSICAVEEHVRRCREVNGLSTQIKKSKPDPNDVISVLNTAKTRVSSVVEHISATRTSVKSQVSDLPAQIDNMAADMIKMFDALKNNIVQEAHQREISLEQGLDIFESKCDEISKNITEHIIIMKNVAEKGSPEQIFIVAKVFSSLIKQYLRDIDREQNDEYDVSFMVKYDQTLKSFMKQGYPIGELVVNQRKTSTQAEETSYKSSPKTASLVLQTAIDVKEAVGDQEEPIYSGLAFLPDGRLVVIDNNNDKCYVMNERLEKLGMYQFQWGPCTVAVISTTEVAVSGGTKDNRTLHILTISPDHRISLKRIIKCSSCYDSLSLMNDDTLIASTYEDNRPVRMISLSGRESDLHGLPEREYQCDDSSSTYLRNEDVLVFTDRFDHAVYIYDIDGNKCALRCVVKHENIKEPLGVCAGPGETIFVCSKSTNFIVQLSLSGEVLGTIKVDMEYPRTVCMNKNETTLIVSNSATGKKKIHLYIMNTVMNT